MSGLWAMVVSVEDQGATGAGVLYMRDGECWGGNDGWLWKGTYEIHAGGVSGTMRAGRYIKGATPLFQGTTNPDFFMMKFSGSLGADRGFVACEVVSQPELRCNVELKLFVGEPLM